MPFLLRNTLTKWRKDNASGMAAALAYYTLFSIVPLTIIVIAILSSIFGRSAAEVQISRAVSIVIGPDVARFTLALADANHASNNVFIGVISLLITLFAALGAFRELQVSLNRIWQTPLPIARSFWRRVLPNTALFILLLATGLLFFGAAVLTLVWGTLLRHLPEAAGGNLDILGNTLFIFFLSTMLFGSIYRFIPRVSLKAHDVMSAALTTAFLFTLGDFAIGTYFRLSNPASLYGTASTVIVLLLWVYYSAMIFYFGAELSYVNLKARENSKP